MMEDNKQLAQRIDGAIQSASQEVTNLRSELSATSRRLAELGASRISQFGSLGCDEPAPASSGLGRLNVL
uniref:Kazrin n=1 Tax=Acanthochromis polyacanthus TaxID=80966 RepID=A0A3Q1GUC8_9TELE